MACGALPGADVLREKCSAPARAAERWMWQGQLCSHLLTLCHHSVLCTGSTARGDGPAVDPTAPGPPGAATAPGTSAWQEGHAESRVQRQSTAGVL